MSLIMLEILPQALVLLHVCGKLLERKILHRSYSVERKPSKIKIKK